MEPTKKYHRWTALICMILVSPSIAQEKTEPDNPDQAKIEEILTRLEERGDSLKDIRCRVYYEEEDKINLSTTKKEGGILFMKAEPNPRFLISFDRTIVDGQLRQKEWYLFDGLWLHEAKERIRTVTKREMVRADERIDLFDIETAPFPLPFGQKKDVILEQFKVTLAPPAPEDPEKTDHLICIPRPGSRMARKYEQLEFFIHQEFDLPSRIVVKKSRYQTTLARFEGLDGDALNSGLAEGDFAPLSAWRRYKETVEKLGGRREE